MDTVGIQLVGRFLAEANEREGLRLWTIIQMLCDPEDTLEWRTAGNGCGFSEEEQDDDLVAELLDLASTKELALMLATPILKYMPVSNYLKFFRRICHGDVDDEMLRAVGFSADMFLDIHRGTFVFPRHLLSRLLSSDDEPLKGIGILLLTHSDFALQDRIEAILAGIELGAEPEWKGFDVVCLTAFREFAREYDLSAIDENYVGRARKALHDCLARNPERQDSVRQTLACLPQEE